MFHWHVAIPRGTHSNYILAGKKRTSSNKIKLRSAPIELSPALDADSSVGPPFVVLSALALLLGGIDLALLETFPCLEFFSAEQGLERVRELLNAPAMMSKPWDWAAEKVQQKQSD